MLLPPLTAIPRDIAAVTDYEGFAQERMTPAAWAWLNGGAEDEVTLRDNREAFRRIRLKPRALRDLAGGDTRLTLFGENYDYPILLAPVAYQKLAHPDGERATVLGAAAMKAGAIVSTQASVSLEEIASAAPTKLWFQLYLQRERDTTLTLVRRAEQANYRALVVTVDAPISGLRNREQRAGFFLPPEVEAVNLRGSQTQPPHNARPGDSPVFGGPLLPGAAQWDDIKWLCGATRLPIVLKGILTPEDALLAENQGVAGIIVSNHGGRTLDGLPATIDVLPAISQALAGRLPLLLDGGIRRGTDVFKALALGASAVLIGRPFVHALAAAGAPGVAHVLHILRAELEVAMALSGCRNLAAIDASSIWPGG